MKILLALLLGSTMHCVAQEYYCPVARTMEGTTFKLDTWFVIGDSTAVIKSTYKDKSQETNYIRLKSTNPSTVYFSDGVMTTTVVIMENSGIVKGMKYSHVLSLQPDARTQGASLFYYCTIIRGK